MNDQVYDVIIIGGGPAGLTAGLYAARSRLKCLLLEKEMVGGQIINAELVENFPGFVKGISGAELTGLMYEQAARFSLEIALAEVTGIQLGGNVKVLRTGEGDYRTRSVIIASGSERVKLGAPGEEQYTGKGVSFCATCDAAFFKDQPVAVVGGGNAALSEAVQLAKFASRVSVIHRRDQLRATKVVQEQAIAEPKVQFIFDTEVTAIHGDDFVKGITMRNVKNGQESRLEVNGVFVAIGFKPNTHYLESLLALDKLGAVMVNDKLETSVPGIFAAGDIRHNSGRQVITAAGDGALAAMNAERYLAERH